MFYLKRVPITEQAIPDREGYFIVETEGLNLPGTRKTRRFETWFNGKSFELGNQTVIAWFKPHSPDRNKIRDWERENASKIKSRISDPDYINGVEKITFTLTDNTIVSLEILL
jgi:hypothetical protein